MRGFGFGAPSAPATWAHGSPAFGRGWPRRVGDSRVEPHAGRPMGSDLAPLAKRGGAPSGSPDPGVRPSFFLSSWPIWLAGLRSVLPPRASLEGWPLLATSPHLCHCHHPHPHRVYWQRGAGLRNKHFKDTIPFYGRGNRELSD